MTEKEKDKQLTIAMSEIMRLVTEIEFYKAFFKDKDEKIYKELEWVQQGYLNVLDDIFDDDDDTILKDLPSLTRYLSKRIERLEKLSQERRNPS